MTAKPVATTSDLLLAGMILFTPLAAGTVDLWAATTLHVTTLCILTLWALSGIRNRQLKLYRTPGNALGLIFLSVILLSTTLSVYRYASVIQIYRVINYCAIFFLVVQRVREREKLIQLTWLITVFGGIYATTSLLSANAEPLSTTGHDLSLTFVNRNHFAGYLELTTWLGVGLAFGHRGVKRVFLLGLSVYMATAVLFSLSRGGFLALTGGLLFYSLALLWFRLQRQLVGLSLFAALVVTMVLWLGSRPVVGHLSSLEDPLSAAQTRLSVWRGTLDMIGERPWLGWGLDSYLYAFPRFQPEDTAQWIINRAHNDYLELAAEVGLLGLLSFLVTIVTIYRFCLQNNLSRQDRLLQSIGLGALSGCSSLLLHGLTDSNLHIPSNALLFAILLAMAVCSTRLATDHPATPPQFCIHLPRKWVPVAHLAAISVAALLTMKIVAPYIASRYFLQSRVHEAKKQYEAANRALLRAIALAPGRAKTLEVAANLQLALALQSTDTERQGDLLSEALKYNDRAISACSTRGNAYRQRASILERLDRTEDLGDTLRKLVELWPVRASAHYAMGNFQITHGDDEGAQGSFRRCVQLDSRYLRSILDKLWAVKPSYEFLKGSIPEVADLRREFADFLYEKDLGHAAAAELGHALALEPSQSRTLDYLRGLCHVNDIDAALHLVRKLLKDAEDIDFLLKVISIHPAFERLQETASVYASPESVLSYLALASSHRRKSSPEKTADVLQEALKRYPQNASLNYHMFIAMRQLENKQDALKFLKRAIDLAPEDSNYCHLLGREYMHSQLHQLAVQQWKKCLQMNPRDQASATALETALQDAGLSH